MKPIVHNSILSQTTLVSGSIAAKLVQFISCGVFAEFIASSAILPLEFTRIKRIINPLFAR